MIIVDVIVPSIGRKYNFSLDEEMSVALLTEEIAEAICQRENCILDGEKEKLNLCSMELEKVERQSVDAGIKSKGYSS